LRLKSSYENCDLPVPDESDAIVCTLGSTGGATSIKRTTARASRSSRCLTLNAALQSFGLPKFLSVMVDRQQQADNDGDYYGLGANLLGSEPQVIPGGVSRRDRRGHG
jgi:hypothetical protein